MLDVRTGLSVAGGRLSPWRGDDCCNWEGVECHNITSHVVKLDHSNLDGSTPNKKELTNLHGRHFLNSSWNHFSGNISDEIDLMSELESLDLSENHLSGEIPLSISALYSLSILNLSYNNLIGRIPMGTQLQTFTNLSYMGNPRLCGEPLQIKCPGDNPPIGVPEEEDMHEDDEYGGIWYFIGFALGFVFGFWVFMGIVMIKRNIRIKYIIHIDRICSWFMYM
ncbi:hypothetical protein ZIOFF_051081 [Zingiber officinale]|uniref:Leucine-rich repeat-containing N-terminal plant-type domain-containing protein n=1 Tax=Zingiber officinale TaxID=94328 RepID=A0A8J5FJY0_ZINOF|nr:hypothetical protein ZIOFF_051081 [Zingiber officinale]